MENATKALLMAAGVLIGILILSLGVVLFTNLSSYVDSSQSRVRFNDLNAFNTQFIKFINTSSDAGPTAEPDFKLTIQDVVTAANLAYENNISYNLDVYQNASSEIGDPKFTYVRVQLDGMPIDNTVQKDTSPNSASNLLAGNLSNEYICTDEDVKFSEITGRIYEVNFHKKN